MSFFGVIINLGWPEIVPCSVILGLDYTCCTVSTLTWLVIVVEHLFRSNECARPATQEKTSQIVAFGVWIFSGFTTGFMAKYASSTKGIDYQKFRSPTDKAINSDQFQNFHVHAKIAIPRKNHRKNNLG